MMKEGKAQAPGSPEEPKSGGALTVSNGGDLKEASIAVRVGVIVAVLAAGALTMMGLVQLKKQPAEAKVVERSLSVETIRVMPEDIPVTVLGLGEVRSLNVVPVSPEIPGTVVEIHPHLEMGEVIPAGELLFRIDQRDYEAARAQARAQVAQMEKTVERLNHQFRIDQDRLKTLERSESLMEEEFARVKTLYEQDEVGTQSAVDHAEMSLNQASDARDQLAQAVTLYPVRIEEAESGLEGARAQLAMAESNLTRTEVRAEFDARVKEVSLEAGQYVNPGMKVLTLADDRTLEISVSVDSRDAKDWLEFEPGAGGEGASWFGELKPVACNVRWTEDPQAHYWEGHVHRIETFDQKTRTVAIAVRLAGEATRAGSGGLPLVEGMFCSVEIPGKAMTQVYRLPRWAVSYEGKVYLARDNRLVIQDVDVLRSEGEETYVRGGLNPGDTVITTRLVNPLPNTLLETGGNGAHAS